MTSIEIVVICKTDLHRFPTDSNTFDISFQFLWGPALLISPVVDEGATTVDIYFPQANWYNYYTVSS